MSFYEDVGGHETFRRIVHEFYARVAVDPRLAPMYPEDDFAGAEQRLLMFLEQYWGGPGTYSAQRGHPRLRMRHNPYVIDSQAHDAWLENMMAAVDSIEPETLDAAHRAELKNYLRRAAAMMVNSPD